MKVQGPNESIQVDVHRRTEGGFTPVLSILFVEQPPANRCRALMHFAASEAWQRTASIASWDVETFSGVSLRHNRPGVGVAILLDKPEDYAAVREAEDVLRSVAAVMS